MRPSLPLPHRIDRAIHRLGELPDLAALPQALAVGRIVTEELQGGDPGAHHRGSWAAAAIRRLARDPRLPVSESSLYRCIGIHEVASRHEPLHPDLRLGHLRAVLGLPPEHQDRLLAAAVRERLRARDLEAVVRAHRDREARHPSDRLPRRLHRLATTLDELPASALSDAGLFRVVRRIRDRAQALLVGPAG